ncbi:MAG: hypothetical protein EPN23_08735 [Verrucomicrobia bacterium]|nr:MAG: hypothetical protein EPN23_08735 [Verrucomicrobiota bacterium]
MKHAAPSMEPTPLVIMRRQFQPRVRCVCRLFEPTALLNAIVLVAAAFLLTARFVLQPGVTVELPEAPFHEGAPYGAMVVTLSQEGLLFFNDERMTLDDLRAAFAQARHDQPAASLVIEADARVSAGTLVNIYNMALAAGVQQVLIAGRLPAPAEVRP